MGEGQGTRSFAAWEELKAAIEEFRQPADADLAAHLRDELWEVVGLYQEEKRRAGQLDFMDLLLCARDLLRHDGARADLQQRLPAHFRGRVSGHGSAAGGDSAAAGGGRSGGARLAQGDAGAGQAVRGGRSEAIDLPVPARRCAAVSSRVLGPARGGRGGRAKLTSSTRSTAAIQSFVNAAFEQSIENYLPLEGGVEAPAGQPSIVALPMPEPYGTRNISNVKIDACSPDAVAAFIQWLCNESGWKVRDRSTRRVGAGAAGARVHSVPAVHELRHGPDAGVRALPGGARDRAPAGGVEIVSPAGGGGDAADGAARDRVAGR